MSRRGLLVVACACATIDRIEGAVAVMEWPGGLLSEVPVLALPPRAQEGDQLVLVLNVSPPPEPARNPSSIVVSAARESSRPAVLPSPHPSTPKESGHERQ